MPEKGKSSSKKTPRSKASSRSKKKTKKTPARKYPKEISGSKGFGHLNIPEDAVIVGPSVYRDLEYDTNNDSD